jgi:hypothetical protein
MVDTDLIVESLRSRGHEVGHVIPTPENAGEYEFEVDGAMLSLEEARELIEADAARAATAADCGCDTVLVVVEEKVL